MKTNVFIDNVKELLGIDIDEHKSKKKSVKSLLKKLYAKRKKTLKELSIRKDDKDLQLELSIIDLKIKKGQKILKKIKEKKAKK